MLKTRMIGVLVVKQGLVVQSLNFRSYLPVGIPPIALEYLDRWGIDEIVMVDIDATPSGRLPDFQKIKEYCKHALVPLTVGGGITQVADMIKIIQSGADKVVINSAAVANPALITEGVRLFGNQCLIVCLDVRAVGPGQYEAFTHSGTRPTGLDPVTLAKRAEEYGAGELLLNSIDRDGSKRGYDLELIRQVLGAIEIPLIVLGGVNHPRHFQEAIELGVSAVAAANFFHYTEHSVIAAKSYLLKRQAEIRLDSYANYDGHGFDQIGRVAKLDDAILEKFRFEYFPEEVI